MTCRGICNRRCNRHLAAKLLSLKCFLGVPDWIDLDLRKGRSHSTHGRMAADCYTIMISHQGCPTADQLLSICFEAQGMQPVHGLWIHTEDINQTKQLIDFIQMIHVIAVAGNTAEMS